MSMKSVGVVLISDDILKGKKNDGVSKFLVEKLNLLEYTVSKVTVIPDSESVIVNELDSLIKNVDIVTVISERHCRIFRAIGRVISQELRQSDELVQYYKETGTLSDKEEVLLPIQAKVLRSGSAYPIVHFQRIFILKENHLKESFNKILKDHLSQYRKPRIFKKTIEIRKNGNSIADFNETNKVAAKSVTVEFSQNEQFYVFNISSMELDNVVRFMENVRENFETYKVNFMDRSEMWESVYSSNESHIKSSIESIERCLEQYGIGNIFVSFNGGKDCTVLLHLVLTVINKKYPNYTEPILCLYVQSDKPFPEQDEFINQAKSYYNLKILTIRAGIKDALHQTLEKFPNYNACLMGTRRTDPYSSELNVFQMTDSNWPQIMRVSPLLDWHYSDVWDYLLYFKVPYCRLYDIGFTSLGNTVNTTKNPSLIYYDHFEGKEIFLPAYKLLKEFKERNGRDAS